MPTEPVLSAREHSQNLSVEHRKIAMFVVALAFIMDLLDSTIVNIAIPSIQANLGASYTTIQWLIAGYALAFALLLITGGRMGDVFGYRKVITGCEHGIRRKGVVNAGNEFPSAQVHSRRSPVVQLDIFIGTIQ